MRSEVTALSDWRKVSKQPIKTTLWFRGYRLSVWVLQDGGKKEKERREKIGDLVNEMDRYAEKNLVRLVDIQRRLIGQSGAT